MNQKPADLHLNLPRQRLPFFEYLAMVTRQPAVQLILAGFLLCIGTRNAHAQEGPLRAFQNIFDPLSAPAEELKTISWLVLAICLGIFVIVGSLLLYAVIRYRRRGPEDDQQEPPQVYGSAAIELAWVVPPVLIVLVLVLVTARTVGLLNQPLLPKETERLTVIGHRFWWEVKYPGEGAITANEIHVPLSDRKKSVPTDMTLLSADVIHGFWVPQLNGKLQAVPNYKNDLWIEPFAPGIYLGNCTVLCGPQHANMLIRVVVDTPEAFKQWLEHQKENAVTDPSVATGQADFINNSCGTCHAIRGTQANGVFGPDLTHFASRATLGSGVAANDDANLRSWVKNPQTWKPGCRMPDMKLNDSQVNQIVAYLKTLK